MALKIQPTCPYDDKYGAVNVSIEVKEGSLVIEVETVRLRILSVTTNQYTAPLVKLYGDKSVNKLVGSGTILESQKVIEKVARWHKRWSDKDPFSGYVIVEKKTGTFVGQIILKPVKDRAAGEGKFVEGVAEIGYLSVEEQWGKKYGQEYTHAMVHHLLPRLIDAGYRVQGHRITSIMATAREDNIGSNCVLGKFMNHTATKERYGGMREWYEHRFNE